jgi:cell division protease FtsH
MGHQRDYSEHVAGVVDEEVRRLVENAHDEAWHVINDNRDILDKLVLELLEKETLGAKELAEIFAPIVKRPLRPTWLSSDARAISERPPVLTPAEAAASSNGHLPAMPPPGSAPQDTGATAATAGYPAPVGDPTSPTGAAGSDGPAPQGL